MSNKSGDQLNKKIILPLIAKYKDKRENLKKMIKDPNISAKEKLALVGKLTKLPSRSRPTRYNSRCVFSFKTASVDRKTGLNMFQLRRLASSGKLPGYIRISW
jgi:small subunit ribosomal protein S14